MTVTIELPSNLEGALKAQANTHGISEAGYIRTVLEWDLAGLAAQQAQTTPFKTGKGSFAKYGIAPSAEEIEANRSDMFHGFAEDF